MICWIHFTCLSTSLTLVFLQQSCSHRTVPLFQALADYFPKLMSKVKLSSSSGFTQMSATWCWASLASTGLQIGHQIFPERWMQVFNTQLQILVGFDTDNEMQLQQNKGKATIWTFANFTWTRIEKNGKKESPGLLWVGSSVLIQRSQKLSWFHKSL